MLLVVRFFTTLIPLTDVCMCLKNILIDLILMYHHVLGKLVKSMLATLHIVITTNNDETPHTKKPLSLGKLYVKDSTFYSRCYRYL